MGHLGSASCTVLLISALDQSGRKQLYHYVIEAKSLCIIMYCCNMYTVKTDVKTKAKVPFEMDIVILAKK